MRTDLAKIRGECPNESIIDRAKIRNGTAANFDFVIIFYNFIFNRKNILNCIYSFRTSNCERFKNSLKIHYNEFY